jgi:hypothetical protein
MFGVAAKGKTAKVLADEKAQFHHNEQWPN